MIDFSAIQGFIPFLLGGLWVTLTLALVAAFGGLLVGLLFALILPKNNLSSKIIKQIIDIFRGTPVSFQLIFFHFALPQLIPSLTLNPWVSAVLIFIINSACYMAEIIRAGLNSIHKGQYEAALTLGISEKDFQKDILVPQAIRTILPALINEFITLIKETSVVSFIGLSDILRRSQIIQSTTFRYFESLIIVGLMYYLLTKGISLLGTKLEKELAYDHD